jgi:uncharacterized delta-60 repeat protein
MRMRGSQWRWSWCLLILVSAAQVLLRAGDGVLDPTFGSGGKVTTSFLAGASVADVQDLVIQPDGRIVAVGSAAAGIKRIPALAVARYNPDGSLDTEFGFGGLVITQVSPTGSRATGVALQADGKIVVIGQASGPTTSLDFALLRYNMDGSLDTTFGSGGVARTDFGHATDIAKEVVIDDVGRILVVGGGTLGSVRTIEVARYNSDGSLDKSFATGGMLVTTLGTDARAVALQADGRIVIAGTAVAVGSPIGDTNFVLLRLEQNGSLDASFGDGGVVTTDFEQGGDTVNSLMIQPDGRIVAAGTVTGKNNTEQQYGLARYHPDGTLDATFGDGGRVVTDLGSKSEWGAEGCLESDGRIVFIGTSRDEFAMVRYTPDGILDPTFGTDGVVRADFSTDTSPQTTDLALAVAIQSDGKIVVGGTSIDTTKLTSDAAILRLGSTP